MCNDEYINFYLTSYQLKGSRVINEQFHDTVKIEADYDCFSVFPGSVDLITKIWRYTTRLSVIQNLTWCALVETGQLNLKNRVFAKDSQPIDSKCQCSTCKRYTRAYLHSIATVEPVSCNHIQNVYVYKTFIWVHARTSRQKLHFNANFNLSILSNRLLELQDQTGIVLQ